jgi:hypothetical protein
VYAAINEIDKQRNDNASKCAAERAVKEDEPAAAISLKDGMRQPSAKNACGYAGKDAALE